MPPASRRGGMLAAGGTGFNAAVWKRNSHARHGRVRLLHHITEIILPSILVQGRARSGGRRTGSLG